MKKLFDCLKSHPLLTGVIGFAFGVWLLKLLNAGDGDLLKMTLLRLSLTTGEAFFLYLISGEKVFSVGADTYVISGKADGLAALASYIGLIVIIAIAVVIIYKKVVKTIDFEEIRKSW